MYIYYYDIIYYVYLLLLLLLWVLAVSQLIWVWSSWFGGVLFFLCPWVLWFFSWPPGHHWGAPKWGPIPVQDLAGKWKVYLKFPQHLKSHAIRASRNGVPSKSTILEIRFQETIHLECSNFGHIICYIYTYLPPLPLSLSHASWQGQTLASSTDWWRRCSTCLQIPDNKWHLGIILCNSCNTRRIYGL